VIRERRAAPAMPRDRFLLSGVQYTEHMRGFVAFGMSLPLPDVANQEYRYGYSDHRENCISHLTAFE
jgi:hypothetical protein